jgi:pyruvate/2-oxoglutarate dehydrogenase complex dihydrolipoamide dehydrogenase (E3) component
MKFDGNVVVSSTEALSFSEVPKKLLVIGGGAIGLEMGSVWSRSAPKLPVLEFPAAHSRLASITSWQPRSRRCSPAQE